MNRPAVIWVVWSLCALLIIGAMGWATVKALDLEERQAQADASAQLQERVRLSLAQMDTAAAGLLILENQRPPHHYHAFFEPDEVLTRRFQVVVKGSITQPSPLLDAPPPFVRLHFEAGPDGQLVSPQVPVGNERDLAEQRGAPRAVLDRAAADLAALGDMLSEPARHGTPEISNFSVMCSAVDAPTPEVAATRLDVTPQAPAAPAQSQADLTAADQTKRAVGFEQTVKQAVDENILPAQKFAPARAAASRAARDSPPAPAAGSGPAASQASAALPPADVVADVTPLRPLWLDGHLIAVREVTDTSGAVRYQGVWFRADALSGYLLEQISHLLPEAGLVPAAGPAAAEALSPRRTSDREAPRIVDPLSLVTLPWRLDAGERPMPASLGFTPLRLSLAVGWLALVFALAAVAALLAGVMKLSSRRATFVSSVTHELRTPLTTFQLYTDLLAENVVTDETKRRSYLETLRREAARLNHLIENVLAYSRVEQRGATRGRTEKLSLRLLAEGILPRLEERAARDEAQLDAAIAADADQIALRTDPAAVEQIVFNLVDNACKYGLGADGPRVVNVRFCRDRRGARVEVCDDGAGIARTDLRKLFRPFHKSASEAAHSKPGVGLGLALCRRLARALGGDLTIDRSRPRGACFVLTLPRI